MRAHGDAGDANERGVALLRTSMEKLGVAARGALPEVAGVLACRKVASGARTRRMDGAVGREGRRKGDGGGALPWRARRARKRHRGRRSRVCVARTVNKEGDGMSDFAGFVGDDGVRDGAEVGGRWARAVGAWTESGVLRTIHEEEVSDVACKAMEEEAAAFAAMNEEEAGGNWRSWAKWRPPVALLGGGGGM